MFGWNSIGSKMSWNDNLWMWVFYKYKHGFDIEHQINSTSPTSLQKGQSMIKMHKYTYQQHIYKEITKNTFTSQWHILQCFYEFLFVNLLRIMSTVPESGLRSDPSLVLVLVWPLFLSSHPCGVLYSLRTSPPMSHAVFCHFPTHWGIHLPSAGQHPGWIYPEKENTSDYDSWSIGKYTFYVFSG